MTVRLMQAADTASVVLIWQQTVNACTAAGGVQYTAPSVGSVAAQFNAATFAYVQVDAGNVVQGALMVRRPVRFFYPGGATANATTDISEEAYFWGVRSGADFRAVTRELWTRWYTDAAARGSKTVWGRVSTPLTPGAADFFSAWNAVAGANPVQTIATSNPNLTIYYIDPAVGLQTIVLVS